MTQHADAAQQSPQDAPAAADRPEGPDLADLGLPTALLEQVLDLGFVRPTPIQSATIPALLSGRAVTTITLSSPARSIRSRMNFWAPCAGCRREAGPSGRYTHSRT